MNTEKVIDFGADGQVSSMHQDEFNLGFLGNQHIKRASEIKFNEALQKWEIQLPVGGGYETVKECPTFDSYNAARSYEVLWMNCCRKNAVEPDSEAGRKLALKCWPFDTTQ